MCIIYKYRLTNVNSRVRPADVVDSSPVPIKKHTSLYESDPITRCILSVIAIIQ